jgi:hypothetical protein
MWMHSPCGEFYVELYCVMRRVGFCSALRVSFQQWSHKGDIYFHEKVVKLTSRSKLEALGHGVALYSGGRFPL